MTWVIVFLVVGVIAAIAAVFVFREAIRLSEQPPEAVFDPDDALEWVIDHLDDRIAATLTPADAKRIIAAQMEFFRERGVSRQPGPSDDDGGDDDHEGDAERPEPDHPDLPVVFATDEAVAFIVERCAATGEAYHPEQVEAVMACQMDYLRYIGAVGREAGEDGTDGSS